MAELHTYKTRPIPSKQVTQGPHHGSTQRPSSPPRSPHGRRRDRWWRVPCATLQVRRRIWGLVFKARRRRRVHRASYRLPPVFPVLRDRADRQDLPARNHLGSEPSDVRPWRTILWELIRTRGRLKQCQSRENIFDLYSLSVALIYIFHSPLSPCHFKHAKRCRFFKERELSISDK